MYGWHCVDVKQRESAAYPEFYFRAGCTGGFTIPLCQKGVGEEKVLSHPVFSKVHFLR